MIQTHILTISSDKFCYLCNSKIFSDQKYYQSVKSIFENNNNKYIINSNCVFSQDSLVCTKCFSNIEVITLKIINSKI